MYKRFLILIFFTLAFRLNAGNFYIDKNASGSDNGSSWSDAWENFQNINWDSIKPGDTIFVSGGTDSVIYTDFMEIGASGVESNLVTITKGIDPGHNGRVIIEGLNNEKTTAFHIEDKNFLKISNFEIRRFTGGGSIRVENSIGSVIEKNKILGYGSCVKIYNSFNCIIRENVLTTHENTPTQTDGIYASQNTDNVYENNNIIILNQDSYPHCDCIQLQQENSCIIRNNYLEQINDKTENSQGIFDKEGAGLHVYYNNVVIVPNTGNSNVVAFQNFDIGSGTLRAYNNTIVGGDKNVFINDDPQTVVKNNIFVTTGPHAHVRFYLKINDLSNIDYNLYYRETETGNDVIYAPENGGTMSFSEWQSKGGDIHGINANPLLTENGKIMQNSPAIDAGANLSTVGVTTDINGTSRPQQKLYDIGAYEFTEGKIISAPRNLQIKK